MKTIATLVLVCLALLLGGCAQMGGGGYIAPPEQLTAPMPIQGNAGTYLSPYTQAGQLTDWMRSVLNAQGSGASSSTTVEAFGAQQSAASMPSGSLRNTKALRPSDPRAQSAAAEAAGGFEFMREHSDLSFVTADDLCVYLYVKYSRAPEYGRVSGFLSRIYPEMQDGCRGALNKASGGRGSGVDSFKSLNDFFGM